MFSSITEREQRLHRENIVGLLGVDAQKSLQAIEALSYIYSIWDPRGDTVKVAMEDIEVLHVLPDNDKQRKIARSFFRQLFTFLEKDSNRRLRNQTARALLPSLSSCSTQIDYRQINRAVFDWRSDLPEKYKPNIIGSVPVALIKIILDEGDPIVFQCDKEDLEMLNRKFRAVLKEMEAK